MSSLHQATPADVSREIDPFVAKEIDRHLRVATDWHPHEYVPWSEGRNFVRLGGDDWDPGQSKLSDLAKTAMTLNLLTEDNLPSYHLEVNRHSNGSPAAEEWTHRWTAEEGRHAIAMRDYLVVTRSVDPVELEHLRMAQVMQGWRADLSKEPSDSYVAATAAMSYTCVQELATRISHRNTGVACNDPVADGLLARIAKDENLHMLFYRNLIGHCLDIVPDKAIEGIYTTLSDFVMPGSTVPGFKRMALSLAWGEIYNIDQHRREVVAPLIRQWNLLERTDYSAEGEVWRDKLAQFVQELDEAADKFCLQQQRRRDRAQQ